MRRFNPIASSTLEELRRRIARASSNLTDLTAAEEFQFFIRTGDELVGTVTLKNISHSMGYGELGYGVSEDHHGKGIATAAVRAFVTKIFAETSLRRLFAHVADDNVASCRVLEKLGFVREGVCREHYLINGVPTDEVLYAVLRREWRG